MTTVITSNEKIHGACNRIQTISDLSWMIDKPSLVIFTLLERRVARMSQWWRNALLLASERFQSSKFLWGSWCVNYGICLSGWENWENVGEFEDIEPHLCRTDGEILCWCHERWSHFRLSSSAPSDEGPCLRSSSPMTPRLGWVRASAICRGAHTNARIRHTRSRRGASWRCRCAERRPRETDTQLITAVTETRPNIPTTMSSFKFLLGARGVTANYHSTDSNFTPL